MDHGRLDSSADYAWSPVQHVWVDTTRTFTKPEVGLLLMWRRNARGRWEAWCVVAERGHPSGGGPRVRQGWYDVEHVRPVGGGKRRE